MTSGRCRITVGEQNLEGGVGTLFVLPAGISQYQTTIGPTQTTFIGFCSPTGVFDESARMLMLESHDPAWIWLEQLCDWQLTRPPLGREVIRHLLEGLLRRIAELDVANGSRERMHPTVAAAIAHMEYDLAKPLQLTELAKVTRVSVSHLGALFVSECGCSPMRYQQQRRLDRAQWLLDNPYLRIHEVAQACGYADENYFVRLFRCRFGHPPGRWRRQRINPPVGRPAQQENADHVTTRDHCIHLGKQFPRQPITITA